MNSADPRDALEGLIRSELFGPQMQSTVGRIPLDLGCGVHHFSTWDETRAEFFDMETEEEILKKDPLSSYAVGVLSPSRSDVSYDLTLFDLAENCSPSDADSPTGLGESSEFLEWADVSASRTIENSDDGVDDYSSFALAMANDETPSAMGLSFCLLAARDFTLDLDVHFARYEPFKVAVREDAKGRNLTWWVRRPVLLHGSIDSRMLEKRRCKISLEGRGYLERTLGEGVEAWLYSRRTERDGETVYVATVALCNLSTIRGAKGSLFQTGFRIAPSAPDLLQPISYSSWGSRDDDASLRKLLYRTAKTYAVGHGAAGVWERNSDEPKWVAASGLPAFEVPDVSAEVLNEDEPLETYLQVDMKLLAEADPEGDRQIEYLLERYRHWIEMKESECADLPSDIQGAAAENVYSCRSALRRMEEGWQLIRNRDEVREAFCLANQAMLLQQAHSKLPLRKIVGQGKLTFAQDYRDCDWKELSGKWRGFQIAFFLTVLPETIDPTHPSREVVDLIYFPTGGGKTEAYLLLAAFSILYRRIQNREDDGTVVIMRYTLRLLTAQQFVRAATLICVLEDIRKHNAVLLGERKISIGIWVGSATTPNTQAAAFQVYQNLQKNRYSPNKFLLTRCPWCGAEMGVYDGSGMQGVSLVGYWKLGKKIVLACADFKCPFSIRNDRLPIYVIDEDIYRERPSFIIGTLDKFATLAWKPEARSLFGIGTEGARIGSPPSLFIQDELHLVGGPLGSMDGIYEPLLADLCTVRSQDGITIPKIVAATATIRNFRKQVELLYGRKKSFIFPPQGLEENENFFAHKKRDGSGNLCRGRRYLGIMAPGASDEEIQTRISAILLQGAADLPEENRDGYWTNLTFFSSLNELGNAVALLRSELPTRLKALFRRRGKNVRYLNRVLELTSRRRGDEVARAIDQLQTPYETQKALDICLATSMIEVGIDVDRLGLMTIIGQPKTTAQYIQVTGRVGRKTDVNPGLVLVVYKPYRPRDRSFYEHFQSYHEHLYSQVEPNSLTPFSTPVLEKALHAVIIAHIRMWHAGVEPDRVSEKNFDAAVDILRDRASLIEPMSMRELERVAHLRKQEWRNFAPERWEVFDKGPSRYGLMRFPGKFVGDQLLRRSWAVPTSLRSVDAECKLGMATLKVGNSDGRRALLGTLRRSHVISPFGVGSLVTTADGLSVLVRGIDEWFDEDDASLDVGEFRICDDRLEELLGVTEFRTPPDYRTQSKKNRDTQTRNVNLTIPAVRFPTWLYCPRCGHLEKKKPTLLDRVRCPFHGKLKPIMVQVPVFLMCERGHLDDFPFDEWLHSDLKSSCRSKLKFVPLRNGASGQYRVTCESCGRKRLLRRNSVGGINVPAFGDEMDGSTEAERAGLCQGGVPWLQRERAKCSETVKVALLGELNAYFPLMESAVHLSEQNSYTEMSGTALRSGRTWTEQSDWRYQEFKEIRDTHDEGILVSHNPGLPTLFCKHFSRVRAIDSMTETRVLRGFTRVRRGSLSLDEGKVFLSSAQRAEDVTWLPASRAVGEGIYFELNPATLAKWESDPLVMQRVQTMASISGSSLDSDTMNSRFVLLHTLNHLLISRLIFECGYGSASLRERLFCSTAGDTQMAGSLIYTSSSDSEGTLGGLVRMSEPDEFERILMNALQDGVWCSSDPVCMELGNEGQGSGSHNLAACYSCALVPEPSCERGNHYLDRGLVVGTIEDPEIGYFSDLVRS